MFSKTSTLRAIRSDALSEVLLFLHAEEIGTVASTCRPMARVAFGATLWEWMFFRDAPDDMAAGVRRLLQAEGASMPAAAFVPRAIAVLTQLRPTATAEGASTADVASPRALPVVTAPVTTAKQRGSDDSAGFEELPWCALYRAAQEVNTPHFVESRNAIRACLVPHRTIGNLFGWLTGVFGNFPAIHAMLLAADGKNSSPTPSASSAHRRYPRRATKFGADPQIPSPRPRFALSSPQVFAFYFEKCLPVVVASLAVRDAAAPEVVSLAATLSFQLSCWAVSLCTQGAERILHFVVRSTGDTVAQRRARTGEVFRWLVPGASWLIGALSRTTNWREATAFAATTTATATGGTSAGASGPLLRGVLAAAVALRFVNQRWVNPAARPVFAAFVPNVPLTATRVCLAVMRSLLTTLAVVEYGPLATKLFVTTIPPLMTFTVVVCAIVRAGNLLRETVRFAQSQLSLQVRWGRSPDRRPSDLGNAAGLFVRDGLSLALVWYVPLLTWLQWHAQWVVGTATGLSDTLAAPGFLNEAERGDRTFLLGMEVAACLATLLCFVANTARFLNLSPDISKHRKTVGLPIPGCPENCAAPEAAKALRLQQRWRMWAQNLWSRTVGFALIAAVEEIVLTACAARIRIETGSVSSAVAWRVAAALALEVVDVAASVGRKHPVGLVPA